MKPELVLTGHELEYTSRARSWLDRERKRLKSANGVIVAVSVPYLKWLNAPSLLNPPSMGFKSGKSSGGDAKEGSGMCWPAAISTSSIPEGQSEHIIPQEMYSFDVIKKEELKMIRDRTDMARSVEALAGMECVALRYRMPYKRNEMRHNAEGNGEAGKLVAWAFLGIDGSLVGLYVEPEHRGLGLAKGIVGIISEKLVIEPMSLGFCPLPGEVNVLDIHGRNCVHFDAESTNLECKNTVKGLCGKEGWRVRWVSVDLERVQMMIGS